VPVGLLIKERLTNGIAIRAESAQFDPYPAFVK
jgi:hypothetical protein